MKIMERLQQRTLASGSFRPVLIACLGDSVTQGCFENGAPDQKTFCRPMQSYCAHLQARLCELYPRCAPTVLNAGVGGERVAQMAARLDRDVLSFKPDLVTLHAGLNDCLSGGATEQLNQFRKSLGETMDRVLDSGTEMIVITPNAMCTYLHESVSPSERYYALYPKAIARQTGGWMDAYAQAIREEAAARDIPVADVYACWQKWIREGRDITCMLINYINHPRPELHELIADKILEAMNT